VVYDLKIKARSFLKTRPNVLASVADVIQDATTVGRSAKCYYYSADCHSVKSRCNLASQDNYKLR
jgi:hypothetical protein